MSTKSVRSHHSTRIPYRVLSVGGSDSGGSAGIQADLKTFEARGVFGCTAITTVTAQNTLRVIRAHPMPETLISAQIEAVLSDMGADAIKTGLLGSFFVVDLVARAIQQYKIQKVVIDPVLFDGKGQPIVDDDTVKAYQDMLFPLATVITPNLDEAARLSGMTINSPDDMLKAAQRLHKKFRVRGVLIKGGHLTNSEQMVNLLYDKKKAHWFRFPRLPVENPHGVGCTLASAIAAELAKGQNLHQAVDIAGHYLQAALAGSLNWSPGKGRLPVYHAVKHQTGES